MYIYIYIYMSYCAQNAELHGRSLWDETVRRDIQTRRFNETVIRDGCRYGAAFPQRGGMGSVNTTSRTRARLTFSLNRVVEPSRLTRKKFLKDNQHHGWIAVSSEMQREYAIFFVLSIFGFLYILNLANFSIYFDLCMYAYIYAYIYTYILYIYVYLSMILIICQELGIFCQKVFRFGRDASTKRCNVTVKHAGFRNVALTEPIPPRCGTAAPSRQPFRLTVLLNRLV